MSDLRQYGKSERVLELVAKGLSNQIVAARVGLSTRAVATIIRKARAKMAAEVEA